MVRRVGAETTASCTDPIGLLAGLVVSHGCLGGSTDSVTVVDWVRGVVVGFDAN